MAGTKTYVLTTDYHGPAYDDGGKPLTRGDRVQLGEDHLLVKLRIAVPPDEVTADTPSDEPAAGKSSSKKTK